MYPNYNIDILNKELEKVKKTTLVKLILNLVSIPFVAWAYYLIIDNPNSPSLSSATLLGAGIGIACFVFSILQWVHGARTRHSLAIASAAVNIFGSLVIIGPFVSMILDIIILCTIKTNYINNPNYRNSMSNQYSGYMNNGMGQNPYANQQNPNNFNNNPVPPVAPMAPVSQMQTMEQKAPLAKKEKNTKSKAKTTTKKTTKKTVKKKPIKKSKTK